MKRAAVAILCATFWASTARAQTPEARAAAKELFQQARAAMEAKDYAAACPKFEESQRLDPGGGTLLNLAVCHEMFGKTASAWTEFTEALRIAKADNRPDRQELATTHIAALEAKLSRLTVDVPEPARALGVTVRCDGVALGPAAWNDPVPVDPGSHVIEVSAPGKVAWSKTVSIGPEADRVTVTVPVLENEATPPPPVAVPSSTPAAPPIVEEDRGRTMRRTGLIVGGTGLLAVGVGAILGVMAIDTYDRAQDQCIPGACSPRGETLADRAGSLAVGSTVLIIAGAAVSIAGVVVYLLSPPKPAAASVASPFIATW